jgi:hypothetical protein
MQTAHDPASSWVSDDVWALLDPHAGRLTHRSVRTVKLGAVALVVVIVAFVVQGWLGILSPRLSSDGGSGISSRNGSRTLTIDFQLLNSGPVSEHLAGLSSSANLRVAAVHGLPAHLAAHAAAQLEVRVVVTNCRAELAKPGSLSVQVDRPWGHVSKRLDLPITNVMHTACH